MNIRFAIVILMTFCFACDFVQEPIVEYDYTDIDDPSQNQTVLDSGMSDGTANNTVADSGTSDGSSHNPMTDSGMSDGSSHNPTTDAGESDGSSNNTIMDAGADNGSDATDHADGGTDDSDDGSLGQTGSSCGAASQGLTPVDCTENGDVNAFCVYSNHCACSIVDGFQCETPYGHISSEGAYEECAAGSGCILAEASDGGVADSGGPLVGHTASSCGAASQGLTPVDCTINGDANASCVFSNHCVCSVDDGFRCEVADSNSTLGGLAEECEPGSVCVAVD
jgi:hypothetical protein